MREFLPPLDLINGEQYIRLLDFSTYNSIQNNIKRENNEFPTLMREGEAG